MPKKENQWIRFTRESLKHPREICLVGECETIGEKGVFVLERGNFRKILEGGYKGKANPG